MFDRCLLKSAAIIILSEDVDNLPSWLPKHEPLPPEYRSLSYLHHALTNSTDRLNKYCLPTNRSNSSNNEAAYTAGRWLAEMSIETLLLSAFTRLHSSVLKIGRT